MLEIKKVKSLKERLESFIRETSARLSRYADKDLDGNLDAIELAISGLERTVRLLTVIKMYLKDPQAHLEQEIEEYLI